MAAKSSGAPRIGRPPDSESSEAPELVQAAAATAHLGQSPASEEPTAAASAHLGHSPATEEAASAASGEAIPSPARSMEAEDVSMADSGSAAATPMEADTSI